MAGPREIEQRTTLQARPRQLPTAVDRHERGAHRSGAISGEEHHDGRDVCGPSLLIPRCRGRCPSGPWWSITFGFVPNLCRRHTARASSLLQEKSAQGELQRPSSTLQTYSASAATRSNCTPREPKTIAASAARQCTVRLPPRVEAGAGTKLPLGSRAPSDRVRQGMRQETRQHQQHHADDPAQAWSRPETGKSRCSPWESRR